MSQYFTVSANITYKTEADLQLAIQPIVNGCWLNLSENRIYIEQGHKACDATDVVNGRELVIPLQTYQNIGSAVDSEAFYAGAESGSLLIASDDGCRWVRYQQFKTVDGHLVKTLIDLDFDDESCRYNPALLSVGLSVKELDALFALCDDWCEKYEEDDELDYDECRNSAFNRVIAFFSESEVQ